MIRRHACRLRFNDCIVLKLILFIIKEKDDGSHLDRGENQFKPDFQGFCFVVAFNLTTRAPVAA